MFVLWFEFAAVPELVGIDVPHVHTPPFAECLAAIDIAEPAIPTPMA